MKRILFLTILFALFLVPCLGQTEEAQTHLSKVELKGSAIKLGKNEWKIDFKLENKGNNVVYFADNPTEVNGEPKYYVSLNENGKSIKFSSQVFPPSLYSPYSNLTSVELKKLNIGESFSGKIFFKFPLKETIPPIEDPY